MTGTGPINTLMHHYPKMVAIFNKLAAQQGWAEGKGQFGIEGRLLSNMIQATFKRESIMLQAK